MATTVEHALRRTTMHLPDRPQTVEPHAMHGRHHQYQHQQRPPFTPTSSSGTPTNPLPLAWSASSRSRTPAINIPYSRTRTNSHSAGSGSGGAGTPDSGFSGGGGGGGGSGTPPSLAMLRDRRMSRHVSSTASGDKDDMAASAAAGSGSWKERIHKATRDRFRDMKADAEKDLRERLGHASGFESAKGMREDHKLAMENLRQAMAEEEVELIRREEENLNAKRHSKRLPRRRDVVIEDDFEDDEVLWQGDGEGLSREERLKAAVLEEQHVLWDAIKRTGGGGGGASGIRSTASTTTNASVGSSRRRDSDGYASDIAGVRDTNQRSSRLRWGTSPSSSKTLPSTPPTQPGAAANPSSSSVSASASAVDMTMHQRWIPSVSEYAADMREKEKEAAAHAKAKVSPPAKEMRAGTSPSQTQTSSGSWRDWSLPDHMRNSRRAPTPTPGTAQSPPVRSQTPAIPMRAQTPSPTTLKRPIPIPMARAQTPAPAPMQRAHSPVVMAKRSQTPGPGHVRQGSSGSSGVPSVPVAPRMHHRTASESHGGGAGGLFQQELENMAARLRRELAIPSA
ncbi:hypothetical protein BD410DRAFT_846316 [Rickenella mellea]|uniref:Uncharacterized protein n=1 Tax=Rickenella mellea TaxID=50990 RepID=A0A4Y7PFG5_9AGAM|nr:hypothetical protein BD410DRAFT_846316 [Rickenella mellea]